MRLRARAALMDGQVVAASFILEEERPSAPTPPMISVGGEVLSLEAALANYEVIDASPEERRILHRAGTTSAECSKAAVSEVAFVDLVPYDSCFNRSRFCCS